MDRHEGGPSRMGETPPRREFALDDQTLQQQLPEALKWLQFVLKYGRILGRSAVALGVGVTGVAILITTHGVTSAAKATGAEFVWVGLAVLVQGIVIVPSVRHLRRAELAADHRIRPALLAIAIAGAPFVLAGLALGALVIWGLVAAPAGELSPKALLLGGAVVIVWAGVPAIAAYTLIRHRAVWAALDARDR